MEWNKIFTDNENKKKYIEYVKEWEEKIHSLLEFDPDRMTSVKASGDNSLSGMPYVAKDNIAVKEYHLTCGSKMLKDFISPYNATVIEKLNSAGAMAIGKCNMDEFGMGSSGDTSALAVTNNPWDFERVAGGSGAGAAVAAGIVPFALASDTGGSVRQAASFCGTYGLKPTYGSVSRYGLVAYASSFDVIGILSRELATVETVFDLIKGKDERDQTTIDSPADLSTSAGASSKVCAGTNVAPDLPSEEKSLSQKSVFGYLGGDIGLSEPVKQGYKDCINMLKAKGYELKEIAIPSLEYVTPAYYTIAAAEASANLAKYNGIRYGHRSKDANSPLSLMEKTRQEGFGDEVKMRILLGTYVLRAGLKDKYYIKAQKIRTKIINDLSSLFQSIDLLIMPVFPITAFKHGNEEPSQHQQKIADRFTAMANLAGIPALSFPTGIYDNLPVGLQFLAPFCGEKLLFQAAEIIAKEIPVPKVSGFKTVEEICAAGK